MTKTTNPFNITFGRKPYSPIDRYSDLNDIFDSFDNLNPDSEVYILIGPRGCGKTVALSTVMNHYRELDNWIVLNINPEEDILEQIAASIYDFGKVKKLFIKKEFNFSFKGVSFTIKGEKPISNLSNIITTMLSHLKKKGVNVLFCIDEISNNQNVKTFVHAFQNYVMEDYNVYLVMTGLFQNVSLLENEKNLTFLYRAPKIQISPLSIRLIANSYMEIFGVDLERASKLAVFTNGYAYAYQILGYLLFKDNKTDIDKAIINQFDGLLEERAYHKIWTELSELERKILESIAYSDGSNESVMKQANITTNNLVNYKNRLSKKGILDTSIRGMNKFVLPRFKQFIIFQNALNLTDDDF